MKKLLQALGIHFHEWKSWSPIVLSADGHILQERTCWTCGKAEVRNVPIDDVP